MRGLVRHIALGALLFALVSAAPAAAKVRTGPDGPTFYRPPAKLVRGPAGSVIWVRPANALVSLPEASRTLVVAYRSRSIAGRQVAMTGSLALPAGAAPAGGWPAVVWNHVTTGIADACAPSQTTPENTERERMLRADPTVRRLLSAGIAVIRPDYEGIGTRGSHPYLIGASLARSTVDAIRSARRVDRRIGTRWAVAGHSEGGAAALFTGALGRRAVPGLDLRAVAAMAPPSHMRDLFEAVSVVPFASPVTADLTGLAGLVLHGAATEEPALRKVYRDGGLSPRALALLAQVHTRCLADLGRADSWGGIAPSQIPGPNGASAKKQLYRVLDRNDVRRVRIGAGVPVRVDQGLLDVVVPFLFTEEVVAGLRSHGTDVTYERYAGSTHQNITAADQAAGPATKWLTERLR